MLSTPPPILQNPAGMTGTDPHLSALLQSIPDLICSVNKDLQLVVFNAAFAVHVQRVTGEPPCVGSPLTLGLPADCAARLTTWLREALGGQTVRHRLHCGEPHGTPWLDIMAAPVHEKGHIVGATCVARDVGDFMKVERDLQRTSERLAVATQAASIGVFDWDVAKDSLVWDTVMFRLYGLRRGDFGGTRADGLKNLHPQDRPLVEAAMAAALAGERDFDMDFRIICPDGLVRHLHGAAHVFRTADGKPQRVVGVNYDISPLMGAREELRELNTTLERRVAERTAQMDEARQMAEVVGRVKSMVLSNIRHEAFTPMHCILNLADLLSETKLSLEQREWLGTLRDSGNVLSRLLNNMFCASSLLTRSLKPTAKVLHLRSELAEAVKIMSGAARQKGLNLQLRIAPSVPELVQADPALLRLMVLNLIDYAIKRTVVGGVEVHIAPATRARKAKRVRLVLEVQDTGPSIPEETKLEMFKPFFGTDGNKPPVAGSSLGLFVSGALIELLGGTLTAENPPEGGGLLRAQWTTDVPDESVQAPAAEPQPVPMDMSQPMLGQTARRRRVLLVEDNPVNQKVAAALLTRRGHVVAVAKNGEEALAALARRPFDIVFMDVQMPVMDGLAATRRIRAMEKTKNLPRQRIVALTASSVHADRHECMAAGMDDVISKPFVIDHLFQAVENVPHESG